jgi:hypothetical protein
MLAADLATAEAAKRPSPQQRAAMRKALLKEIRKNPTVVGKRSFLRQATFFGFDLPVTLRLTPVANQAGDPAAPDDDSIQIDLGTDATNAPLPAGVKPGVVSSTLKGKISATLRFSQDTAGYGQVGVVELGFGALSLTGTGFSLVNDAAPATCALLETSDSVAISAASGSQGYLSLFGGSFSMDLHTSFAFSSLSSATCGGGVTTTSVMSGIGRPPLPIRIDGSFRISPAMTADGRVRLGKLAMSGAQSDSFVQVHTCLAAPPPAQCAVADDGVVTGRLMTTAFTAELLVGNV